MTEESMTIEELADHAGIKPEDLGKKFSEKHLTKFAKSIANWEQFAKPLGLSDQLITEIKIDLNLSQEMKTIKMLEKWRKKNAFKATYKRMVTICLEHEDAELALEVCKLIKDDKDSEGASADLETPGSHCSGTQTILLERLRNALLPMRHFTDTADKTTAIKAFVLEFVSTSIKSNHDYDGIKEALHTLYKEELLISEEILKEATTSAEQEYAQHNKAATKSSETKHSKSLPKEPLFSKDTIYHADICCCVLAEGDAGNYQSLFKKLPNGRGHSFTAVSMSRSKTERLLIAKQGDSLIYFAFEGRPQLSGWKDYKSFDEGITLQSQQFPIRYIVELLNKQCRIVLTGFSFGGLLASSVTAMIWNLPYISTDLLKENLVCITFGKPLVSVKLAKSVAQRRPDLSSTIHSIHMEDDPVPSLMRFLDVSWGIKELSESEKGSTDAQVAMAFTPLQDPVTSSILDTFQKSQVNHESSKEVFAQLRPKLVALQSELPQLPDLPESIHYMICDPEAGLMFKFLIKQEVIEYFTQMLSPDKLDEKLFKPHTALKYSENVFLSHLDKEPQYSSPPASKHAPQKIENLLPVISEVHVHYHGDQTAIVIEGINLWFCHEVSLLGLKRNVQPYITSGSSIHINTGKKELEDYAQKNTQIMVYTPFSSKPIKQDSVPLSIKGFGVTTRQEQLAKLSPSKVIELAYLSALLEQDSSDTGSRNSHKFEVIATFLKKISKVVPFESISYAIAYSSFETALTCYKALVESGVKPPPTNVMHTGLSLAYHRIMLGVPPQVSIEHTYNDIHAKDSWTSVSRNPDNSDLVMNSFPRFSENIYADRKLTFPAQTVISSTQVYKDCNQEAGEKLRELSEQTLKECDANNYSTKISDFTIDVLYPVRSTQSKVLKSPIDILVDARAELHQLASSAVSPALLQTRGCNKQMLHKLNNIRQTDLEVCTSLLGGFMEQQNIAISLVRSQKDSSLVFGVMAAASVGVWALFSLDYDLIQPILSQYYGEKLLVRILDYVKSISGVSNEEDSSDTSYAAKLQFMAHGMAKTVTCNTQYVSYSLERQLVALCKERNIDASISLSDLQNKWGALFKGKTLSLVERSFRPLIGRWLKWALMVHNLREELAKYTAIGVTGLVNSGKSRLINTLFGIKIPIGTTEASRTTVPFLYDLDRSVEGLNVVDFPGVDDEDDTIGDLADLLITVAQVILFVVDYRKAHTQSAKKWLERLHKEKVPVLVCLTFGDKLYAEHINERGDHLPKDAMTAVVKDQLAVTEAKLRPTGSHKVAFFSFAQDNDSVLNTEKGRGQLRDVGIMSPLQVGEWLTGVFRRDFDNERLADQLEPFMSKNASHAQ